MGLNLGGGLVICDGCGERKTQSKTGLCVSCSGRGSLISENERCRRSEVDMIEAEKKVEVERIEAEKKAKRREAARRYENRLRCCVDCGRDTRSRSYVCGVCSGGSVRVISVPGDVLDVVDGVVDADDGVGSQDSYNGVGGIAVPDVFDDPDDFDAGEGL